MSLKKQERDSENSTQQHVRSSAYDQAQLPRRRGEWVQWAAAKRVGGIFKRWHCAPCKSGQSRCPRSGSDSDALSLLFRVSLRASMRVSLRQSTAALTTPPAGASPPTWATSPATTSTPATSTYVRLLLRPACTAYCSELGPMAKVHSSSNSRLGRPPALPVLDDADPQYLIRVIVT